MDAVEIYEPRIDKAQTNVHSGFIVSWKKINLSAQVEQVQG